MVKAMRDVTIQPQMNGVLTSLLFTVKSLTCEAVFHH